MVLSHVEDEQTFDRYMEVIARVPEIDSDLARQVVLRQLLREPRDYIESCAQELAARGLDLRVEPVVQLGHRLATYRDLVTEHGVQLVVLHTKDEDQLAMHGMSYPLAIELRDIPLLML